MPELSEQDDREALADLIGEGVHTGLRKIGDSENSDLAWRAIAKMRGDEWVAISNWVADAVLAAGFRRSPEPQQEITEERVARAIAEAHVPTTGPTPRWESDDPAWKDTYRDFARAALEAVFAEPQQVSTAPSEQIQQLVRALVDSEACWFDHNGGCQAHGYLWLEQGQVCPHAEAKTLLEEWDATVLYRPEGGDSSE